jgi:hypothetical protein
MTAEWGLAGSSTARTSRCIGVYRSFMTWPTAGSSSAIPSPARATTKCEPPVPSARSTAVVFSSTRSPTDTSPESAGYATARPSLPSSSDTCSRWMPSRSSAIPLTIAQTSRMKNPRLRARYATRDRRADEVAEERRRARRAALELGVTLVSDEPRVIGQFHHLDQLPVR